MAFTRFHDDPDRISRQLSETTQVGIYHLNTPGNGMSNPYIDDIHVRLQKWGANLQTNGFEASQALRPQKLSRDAVPYKKAPAPLQQYGTKTFEVDETRTSLPAWTFREKPQAQYAFLPLNPQANLFFKFDNNCPTRMLEKDYYRSAYY